MEDDPYYQRRGRNHHRRAGDKEGPARKDGGRWQMTWREIMMIGIVLLLIWAELTKGGGE